MNKEEFIKGRDETKERLATQFGHAWLTNDLNSQKNFEAAWTLDDAVAVAGRLSNVENEWIDRAHTNGIGDYASESYAHGAKRGISEFVVDIGKSVEEEMQKEQALAANQESVGMNM